MVEVKCSATKHNVSNDAGCISISCPGCGANIVRSKQARQTVVKYTCSCGFQGP